MLKGGRRDQFNVSRSRISIRKTWTYLCSVSDEREEDEGDELGRDGSCRGQSIDRRDEPLGGKSLHITKRSASFLVLIPPLRQLTVTTVTASRRAKLALMLNLGVCSSAERVLADELELELDPPHEGSEGMRKTPPSVGG